MNKIIILIPILLFAACKNKEYKGENLKYTIHNTEISNFDPQYYRFQTPDVKDTSNATYILHMLYSSKLYKYDFDSMKVIKTYNLSKKIGSVLNYMIHNDTLYALLYYSDKEIAVQPLNHPEECKIYSVNLAKNRRGDNYISYDFDGLHVNIMPKGLLNTMDEFRNWCRTPIDAKIALEADTIRIEYLKVNYPEMYAKAQFPSADLVSSYVKASTPKYNLFSFSLSPELILFNTKKEITYKNFKSNYYVTPAKFDTTKIGNLYSYYYQKSLNHIHFGSISYNKYRDEIYRSMVHQEKTTSKKPLMRSWSLIIGDKDANTKYELIFDEGSNYFYQFIIPTKKGFAVPILTKSMDDINHLIFHEYELL